MATFIDNITDLRYSPFDGTFTAYGYGYDGNDKEVQTVPSSSPYWVYLNEIPQSDSPSTLFINEQGGGSFTEVSFTTAPAASQFRVSYGSDGTDTTTTAGQGIVEFNSADAGKTIEIQYYGLGFINQKQLITNTLKVSNPIGSIISVHPNTKTAYLPDSEYWTLCDTAHAYGGGSATALSSTYFDNTGADLEGYVPDLSDSRFLMGSTAYGLAGSNTEPAHTHSVGSYAANISFDGSDDIQTSISSATTFTCTTQIYRTSPVGSTSGTRAGTPISGTSGNPNSTLTHLPQYFSVLYYMRNN